MNGIIIPLLHLIDVLDFTIRFVNNNRNVLKDNVQQEVPSKGQYVRSLKQWYYHSLPKHPLNKWPLETWFVLLAVFALGIF